MAGFFCNFRNTMIVSFILALIIISAFGVHGGQSTPIFWQAMFRWLHVLFGIMWIGLL